MKSGNGHSDPRPRLREQPRQAPGGTSAGKGRCPQPPPPRKKQATPVELAALLVDTVCVPGSGEREALRELAELLGLESGSMESELMFLRAFAVDFATDMTLGDAPERWAITERFYKHWEMISDQVDAGVFEDLQDRISYYTDAVHSESDGPSGLMAQVGLAFAERCGVVEEGGEDLAMLGGSMFVALFEEISDLLSGIDIVLYDPPADAVEE